MLFRSLDKTIPDGFTCTQTRKSFSCYQDNLIVTFFGSRYDEIIAVLNYINSVGLPPKTGAISDKSTISMNQPSTAKGCGVGTILDEKTNTCIIASITQSIPQKTNNIPDPEPTSTPQETSNESMCGDGTHLENGQCVIDKQSSESSGCLIATATYVTELAPQVQILREVRDNVLSGTNSGTAFMTGFNEFYYSFSPAIADWERQSPLFKETVKLTIRSEEHTSELQSH